MKKLMMLVALAIASPVLATDEFNQTVTLSSGSAVQSTKLAAGYWSLSCDNDVRYKTCVGSTCAAPNDSGAATTTSALVTNFTRPFPIEMPPDHFYISLIRVNAVTTTCHIYRYRS